MCGISGAISKNKININSFLRMNQIIKHRGPDDEGFVLFNDSQFEVLGSNDTAKETWEANGIYLPVNKVEQSTIQAQVAFGHRRLSILDLSPKGHQPMCGDEERYWITFNGEIYNYIEIRDELIQLGHSFNTDTDTEVILNAYKQWGIECLHKFNGMWAFALYDRIEQSIFLSRDRFGIKPLYYWFSPEGDFYFGSEIKQFTVLPGWRAVLNRDRALDYLYYALMDHTDESLFNGVYILSPGCCFESKIKDVKSENGKLHFLKWYNPVTLPSKISFEDAKVQFLEKFKDAIKLHLRADVPVGSALSGGLDSSSIVSYINILLKQQGKSELQKTFSSCSHDERFDERKWMDEVVKETRVDGHFIYPKGGNVFKLTENILWNLDEPYQSQAAYLSNHVFKEASYNKVKVLLNGQGADEYLSGYGAFQRFRHKKLFLKGNFYVLFKEMKSIKSLTNIFLELIKDNLPMSCLSFLHKNFRKKHNLDKILNNKIINTKNYIHPYVLNQYKKTKLLNISEYQIFKDPLQKYLKWEDRNSMAYSVEARVPFLDFRLVEFVRSLPLEYLDEKGLSKKILVESMEGILPEVIRQRKDKKGFITPEEVWFKKDYFEDFVNLFKDNIKYSKGIINEKEAIIFFNDVKTGKIPFSYDYWRIIIFCIWMKIFEIELE
jgi:asparagine synthase (glutamine-hydrolysing)